MTPDEITLFVDRSAGAVTVPGALGEAGIHVVVHDDVYPVETPDHVWIADVGRQGWFAVTLDRRIFYSPISKQTAQTSDAGIFVVRLNTPNAEKLHRTIELAAPRIPRFIEQHTTPFFARIYQDGAIRIWG